MAIAVQPQAASTVVTSLQKVMGSLTGDGAATAVTITHNLPGTIVAVVVEDATGTLLTPTVKITSPTTVQLTFGAAPAAGAILQFIVYAA